MRALEATLAQLPALEHLGVCFVKDGAAFLNHARASTSDRVAASVLQQMQRLTHLELGLGYNSNYYFDYAQAAIALQPLSMLAGLLASRVHFGYGTDNTHHPFTAGSLSGLQRLTRLELVGMPSNKPDAAGPAASVSADWSAGLAAAHQRLKLEMAG